ncbi:hypothetical protein HPB49_005067 [Dermacentor silvarum]|uniref:Uncharacterized protein n=1 Tax=Dermacentor silvarum TaxID=543639 RepID=A0ACB8CDD3_DERSI|nr:hypothetical protein HPB49_005067 [Dermacentor silvarum]
MFNLANRKRKVRKCVIRGIAPCDGPEELDRKIVNSKNPLALGSKRIKSTGTVVVVFDGYKVPNYVSYGGTLVKCTLYRKQVEVCYACGRLGHRADVCPSPDEAVCKGCGVANPDEQHKCDPKCRLCGVRHFTAAKECNQRYQMPYLVRRRHRERSRVNRSKSPAFAKGERQLPDIAGRSRARGSSRSRNPSPRRSGSRSVSRARSGSSVGQQMKRKSTLSWADRVRGGGETGPSRGPRDPLPEQARDAEIARLQKENADLKEMVRKMASEMTEIKKLIISQSALVKASAPTAIEVPVPVSDSAGASKRRSVSSKEESVSQTNEIKGMLATLTTSVQQIHQGLAQVQVALGDPKRGLGALGDRIDALERLVIPSTTPTTPMQVVDPNASSTIIGATSTSTHQTVGNF